MEREIITMEGNEAAAYVAYNLSEVIAIYPITPSSNMGEYSDAWSAAGEPNIWGDVPSVTEMQHEGGAAGAVHGALQAGALTTTFTASQGLLLMIPNMYKIAGELTPAVFHIAARSLAAQGLSIFGDHQDVMATRQTGYAMLSSGSVQEVMDLAAVAHAATLESRIPFLHFFDGFRTSHEISKIEKLTKDDLKNLIREDLVLAHRDRALNPDSPVLRGTSQNPDVYFQGRETVNKYYNDTPEIVQMYMDKLASMVGRQYKLFDYYGHPQADRVIVIMGSGGEAAIEAVDYMNEKGEKVGVVKVRLYRPFSAKHFISAFPDTVKSVAVLDRTKEPGSTGEPLYLDVMTAMSEMNIEGTLPFTMPKIIGGRYGLSSKEFTPAMIKGIYDELSKDKPKNHFTIGIHDDVTHTSLDWDENLSTEREETFRGMFYGLGADGTVSANKNSIKIIGEETENFAQGHFVYDSKKSGAITISHLRFGKHPIHSTYEVSSANFIACHQFQFVKQYDMLKHAASGATFLLNAQGPKEDVWDKLPRTMQQQIVDKNLKLYVIDAYDVAKKTGMGVRINTIMQTCFFAISGILPKDEAIAKIKENIKKTYGKKGDEIVQKNFVAVDETIAHLHEIQHPGQVTSGIEMPPTVPVEAPDFVQKVTAQMLSGNGNNLPVSAIPADGTFPMATARWEKRNIALDVPVWDADICTQCGKCSLICPHACIRQKIFDGELLKDAPATFKSVPAKGQDWPEGWKYNLQVSVEDCTGCELCVEICPVKNKTEAGKKAINMAPVGPIRDEEIKNWDFFLSIPEVDRKKLNVGTIKGSQFLQPLFEFSGACSGCGETPYVKLVTQLFGDRAIIANSTGCSSIYGGNLPTTPYAVNHEGRGPAWSNSLFEDTAEFGLGFRLAVEKKEEQAQTLLKRMASMIGQDLVDAILSADQHDEAGIEEQRERIRILTEKLKGDNSYDAQHLLSLQDYLVRKSVWIFGGDGWAYDIGYSGVDHVIATGKNVNLLVLDTEVYSNTGGQMSKATPTGAVAKFAAGGKTIQKKDLGLQAISYGSVYVAQIAIGANETQTIKALLEAERFDGPSVVIAYSTCIAHGYNMKYGVDQMKLAVNSAYWPLYRFNPHLAEEGKNPLQLDSKDPKVALKEFMYNETRFKMLTKMDPKQAEKLLHQSEKEVTAAWNRFKGLAAIDYSHIVPHEE